MAGRKCGFCTKPFAEGEPFVNVRIIKFDQAGIECLQEEVFDACTDCAERTHIVSGNTLAKHQQR